MAVVQISRIQHRRGQKNTGSGLPQLASGELGWAIDTRELYIGNGAVSEGAPAVGNTKILTEYDNLFSLADTYQYQSENGFLNTGTDSSSPTQRSLQDRLDDRVSIKAFGAAGDGITDDTAAIQRALDQLYLNPATAGTYQSRVKLFMEAGQYRISDTLHVPPFATIIGAGAEKTVIRQTGSAAVLTTVNGSSTPGSPASDATSTFLNQARSINLQGMTLEQTAVEKAVILQSCRESMFHDIQVRGTWSVSDAIVDASTAVEINSLSEAVSSDKNSFVNCQFQQCAYAVRSNWDVKYNTFQRCSFDQHHRAVVFGDDIAQLGSPGQTTGPRRNTIQNSVFTNVNRQAIFVVTGTENVSENNSFQSVGNDGGPETSPASPVIEFTDNANKSNKDWFSRTDSLISGAGLTDVPYLAEVKGSAHYSLDYEKSLSFGDLNNIRLFRLPAADSQTYELEYSITNPDFTKRGTFVIVTNTANNDVEISDDFHFVGDEFYVDGQSFSVVLKTLGGAAEPNTIDVRATANLNNGSESIIKFTVTGKRN